MTDLALYVDNLSLRYCLGRREPYKILRDALARGFTTPFHHLRATGQPTNGNRTLEDWRRIWPGLY